VSGRKTSRNIEIMRFFKNNGHLYFYAFCYTTLKVFMFRADRVDELSFDSSPIDNPSQLLAGIVKE
jgi:predicted DNA-binding transcriptional regulator YafY